MIYLSIKQWSVKQNAAVGREDRDRVRKRSKMRSSEAAERSKLSMGTANHMETARVQSNHAREVP